MKIFESNRGFPGVEHQNYTEPEKQERIIQESSAIGDYDDSLNKPGSSYLWIGDNHHLNRDEIRELRDYLNRWLDTGRLKGCDDGQ